jgi:hypothetical protein
MGWGAETFLKDWDEVVRVQNQATLDGSPVAQAIIKFMEDKEEYSATSSEMHSKLKVVAAQLGVDVERDKAWPKSARWLWRRIKEVLPLLIAGAIEARRGEEKRGTMIALRNIPKNDATNATTEENPIDEPDTGGNKQSSNATANATDAPNATANATRKPANSAESGNSGNSGNRSGAFWENDPMRHYGRKGAQGGDSPRRAGGGRA